MRVTDKLAYDSAIRDNQQARERLDAAQRVASSGMRFVHPSEDPVAAGQLAALAVSSARLKALSDNTGKASSELGAADTALGSVSTALARAREIAVQFSSSAYGADQRASGGTEVAGLLQQVVAAGNTEFGGRYIFGGTADSAPPFDASGAYLGSNVARQVEIAPGVVQTSSLDANAALRGSAGGVDVVATLQQLEQALAANDPTAIQGTLEALQQSITQVASARTDAGVAQDALDTAAKMADALLAENEKRDAALGNADVIESSIHLAEAQQGLQASLSATAQGFHLSLLDYITYN